MGPGEKSVTRNLSPGSSGAAGAPGPWGWAAACQGPIWGLSGVSRTQKVTQSQ